MSLTLHERLRHSLRASCFDLWGISDVLVKRFTEKSVTWATGLYLFGSNWLVHISIRVSVPLIRLKIWLIFFSKFYHRFQWIFFFFNLQKTAASVAVAIGMITHRSYLWDILSNGWVGTVSSSALFTFSAFIQIWAQMSERINQTKERLRGRTRTFW